MSVRALLHGSFRMVSCVRLRIGERSASELGFLLLAPMIPPRPAASRKVNSQIWATASRSPSWVVNGVMKSPTSTPVSPSGGGSSSRVSRVSTGNGERVHLSSGGGPTARFRVKLEAPIAAAYLLEAGAAFALWSLSSSSDGGGAGRTFNSQVPSHSAIAARMAAISDSVSLNRRFSSVEVMSCHPTRPRRPARSLRPFEARRAACFRRSSAPAL